MSKLVRNLHGVVVFAGLTINTVVWFVPIFLLAIVKLVLPIKAIRRGITRLLMSLGENWISVNRWVLAGSGALGWRAQGIENVSRNGWYLVVSNHQTWVDILLLQFVFNRKIPFLKFFIKRELIWFPLLGIAWWALDMPFMKRYRPSYLAKHPEKKGSDLAATRKACEKFRDTPTSVINFVEGTRFSEQKRIKRGSPYRNLLPPRAGGIAVALTSMGELFDAMLDVTIVYSGGVPKFWSLCCGERVAVEVDVRVRKIDQSLIEGDYQNDRDFRRRMHKWLGTIWADKDELIDSIGADSQSGTSVA
ncbi:MAG: acyltransferase [Woeseiaceae bacterium]|nr:acyltransferase [Woeseiaceae bacterium]